MKYLNQLNLVVMRKIQVKEILRECWEKIKKKRSQSGLTQAIILEWKDE